jgi:hypothetical protein
MTFINWLIILIRLVINTSGDPNDTKAVLTDQGWKCGNCIERELQDRIVRVTPNSDRAKEIIAERAAKQKKELEFKGREAEIRKVYGT